MKAMMYKCLDCNHEVITTSNVVDGTRCEKCNGAMVPVKEYEIGIDLAGDTAAKE